MGIIKGYLQLNNNNKNEQINPPIYNKYIHLIQKSRNLKENCIKYLKCIFNQTPMFANMRLLKIKKKLKLSKCHYQMAIINTYINDITELMEI